MKYKIRVVRGAFIDSSILDNFDAKTIEKLNENDWKSIDEIIVNLKQIRKLQKQMVKHYNNVRVPWYLDGYNLENNDDYIVAFGGDDGNGGKIFEFSLKDKIAINEVISYGISKGIPKEQLDWMNIKF